MARLTKAEIELALDKILKRYDEYIYRFFKSPKIKTSFEERYFSAIRNGMDMARFLFIEAEVIEELIKKEDDALNKDVVSSEKKEEGFADRVLRQLRSKIEKYPDFEIHGDANPEIRRLVGALTHLYKQFMPELQNALRNTNYSFNSQVMLALDAQMRSLCSDGQESLPPRLTRYLTQLNVFPRDYKTIDMEEKAFILESAFLLHDLLEILTQVQSDRYPLTPSDAQTLESVIKYVKDMLEDFRLKGFKRRGT